ncbi:MAG: aldo/keto reductase [Gemmatimonadaceae bacterium]|nr:aldo/keto reductase [Gemmatimonadaceae bacterium]
MCCSAASSWRSPAATATSPDAAAIVHTRRIGSLDVSAVGLGCNNFGWRIDEQASHAVIDAALAAGVTFFDTADMYGDGLSEEYLGRALLRRRGDVVIATKFGHRSGHPDRGAHPAHIRRAVEASLQRLQTDWIDLYQLHTPDPLVPIAETLGALDELVAAGKVREIGCSNFSLAQLAEADGVTTPNGMRFESVQNQFSMLERDEAPVVAACERQERAFLPYFPLANGMLTGKYRVGRDAPPGTRITDGGRYAPFLNDANLAVVERIAHFAESRGAGVLDATFAWLLSHRAVASVIAGATKPHQVTANAAASDWQLSAADRAELDSMLSS